MKNFDDPDNWNKLKKSKKKNYWFEARIRGNEIYDVYFFEGIYLKTKPMFGDELKQKIEKKDKSIVAHFTFCNSKPSGKFEKKCHALQAWGKFKSTKKDIYKFDYFLINGEENKMEKLEYEMITKEQIREIKRKLYEMVETKNFDTRYLWVNLERLCSELEHIDEKNRRGV